MTAFEFPCRCGETLTVSEGMVKVGGKVRCPHCKTLLDIPTQLVEDKARQQMEERREDRERVQPKKDHKSTKAAAWGAIVIACLIIVLVVAYAMDRAQRYTPQLSDEATRARQEGDRQRAQDLARIQRLHELASQQPVPPEAEALKPGEMNCGDGFYLNNVSFPRGPLGLKIVGEITNRSDKEYKRATFEVSFYSADDKLLAVGDIWIWNIRRGATIAFSEYVRSVSSPQFTMYKVRFSYGI